tara:strand:- start:338765 stop:341035 length:2271 start_codon:yes stop_codon:yes gene_type:complete
MSSQSAPSNPTPRSSDDVDDAARPSYEEATELDINDRLEASLEQFLAEAPINHRSELLRFVPEHPAEDAQFILVELIKLDMAMIAEAGDVPRIEDYLEPLKDHLSRDQIPVDLVLEELQLRKEAGEEPSPQEYAARFPQFDTIIGPLLGSQENTQAISKRGAPPELAIGQTIDDFVIIQALGSGAFAHVYLAQQQSMQRLVALKVSRGTGAEPQALAQLDHPNIVRVFDQRMLPESGLHLMYMQYQPGGTLADVVRSVRETREHQRGGDSLLASVDRQMLRSAQAVPDRSSIRDWLAEATWPMIVVWIGVQLAEALEEAHRQGVLHRDVKPANVLLSGEAVPKLADFNVSLTGAAGRAGAASTFGGSIGYMAPEHLQAVSADSDLTQDDVGEPADFYSLAILLWELWQGHRPFRQDGSPSSWTQAVGQQLRSREQEPEVSNSLGGAAERILETSLRQALAYDLDDRPKSGSQFAGRLRLALHPDAAVIFEPEQDSPRYRVLGVSPWLIAGAVILVPNIAAAIFNFYYNQRELLTVHPEMKEGFDPLCVWVTFIGFAIGIAFLIWLTKSLVGAFSDLKSNRAIADDSLNSILALPLRSALIGGMLWGIAGVTYPIALSAMYPQFPSGEAWRFFFSLAICGGVAAIYPFFGMTVLVTTVYYPQLIKKAMRDDTFDLRANRVIRQSENFLLAAAGIPLLGCALLISSGLEAKDVMLTAVAATAVGLVAAFFAYRCILKYWAQMSDVLSAKRRSDALGAK